MFEGAALTRVLSAVEIVEKPQIIIPVRLHTYSMDVESGAQAISLLAYALVDTGASKTCICPKLLDQLNCERYELRNLAGSTGQEQVYQRFASIEMMDADKVTFARFDDTEVIEFKSREQDTYKVLLGMDLLGKFDMIQIRGFEISFGSPQV